MKRINLQVLLAVALLTLLTACVREPALEMEGGNAICFSATATVADDMPMTRTVYGSVSGATKNILWTAGDRVSIWSPDAVVVSGGVVTHPAASYGIAGQDAESAYGKATGISPVTSGVALQWGTAATHTFYGKFPDPAWSGAAPYAHDAFKNQDPASASFLCWLPASVSVTPETGVFDYTEDMTYCYMTAYTSSAQRNVAVDLDFSQAVSAFRVNLPHAFRNGALSVSRVEISSASHRLNGEYTVGIAASNTYTVSESSLTAADKSVSMAFSSPVMIPNGTVLSVTLFACPVGAADLTLKLTEASGIERTIPLKTPGGEWISFQPGKYYEINVGEVPSGPVHTFSINDQGGKVSIAPGNLQYIGSAATPYWKFADYQWEWLGTTTGQDSDATNVDRDLFGWGTGNDPNRTSTANGDYETFVDWGTNTIVNGGGYTWRTPTTYDVQYIFDRKEGTLWTEATVAGVPGIILFPDDFEASTIDVLVPGVVGANSSFSSYTISAAGWVPFESAGCVFLPAAKFRYGNGLSGIIDGRYWTSTVGTLAGGYAFYLWFYDQSMNPDHFILRVDGYSVRLVRDIVPGFSVDVNRKVAIAPGNLMAKIESYTSPIATASEWKFGEPWEYVGDGSSDGNYLFFNGDASCVGKWVDMFSWQGASSTNNATSRVHGLLNNTTDYKQYNGNVDGEPTYDGCWNNLPITNGGGYNWRPLSNAEWIYLLNTRSCAYRYAKGQVHGVNGLIIFPDSFMLPPGVTINSYNTESAAFNSNTLSDADWTKLEGRGSIFMPAAGWGERPGIVSAGDYGSYWTSTASNFNGAYGMSFSNTGLATNDSSHRYRGEFVRLARDL